jgi:PAS domain S-box-containing protein
MALRESEERAQAILWAIPDRIFLFSENGRYLACHARSDNDILLPREQLIGKRLHEVVRRPLADAYLEAFRKISESGEPQTIEYDLELHGKLIHNEARIVKSGENKFLAVVRDVTERKRAEMRLRESQEELKRSHAQIRQLAGRLMKAQEEERRTIARELHDDLNQQLAAIAILLSTLRQQAAGAQPIAEQLVRAQRQTNRIANAVRTLSHQLHPPALQHAGLPAALESIVGEFNAAYNTAVALTISHPFPALSDDVAICIYRVAQESLKNIGKHSQARRVQMDLSAEASGVTLSVSDDGCGFDIDRARGSRGLGLISMAERVGLLQGVFKLETRPGAGTWIRASLPAGSETL